MRIRLRDPERLNPPDIIALDKLVTDAMGILAHHPSHGGDPFLFSMAAGKPHVLRDLETPTAATNGLEFMWHPDGIRKLAGLRQVTIRLKHEILHIALDHCSRGRLRSKVHWLWNYAVDYAANTIIEHAWRQQHHNSSSEYDPFNHPLWNGGLGVPVTLEEFKWLLVNDIEKIDPKKKDQLCRVVDMSLYGRSAESIYRELIEFLIDHDKDPRDVIEIAIDLDTIDHLPAEIDKKQLMRQLTRAIAAAQQMRGTVPGYVDEVLGELSDPQTCFEDYLDAAVKRIKHDNGLRTDYTRFRRRFISQGFYLPVYAGYRPKIVVLLDTSGSMSQKAIALLVSELQAFDRRAEMYVVPVDAEPHWGAMTRIHRSSDVPNIQVVGRGGTVFNDFFEQFPLKLRAYGPFDLVIALTDGEFGEIPRELKPNCEVAWVLNRENPNFQPPFGKVVPLNRYEEFAFGT
jgi:predicted metal-dependent peptidase